MTHRINNLTAEIANLNAALDAARHDGDDDTEARIEGRIELLKGELRAAQDITPEAPATYAERVEQLNAEFIELNASGKVSSWPVVTPECIRMREVLSELEAIQGCGAVVYVKPSEVVEGLHTDLLIGIARNNVPLTVRPLGSTQAGRTNCVDSEGRRFNLRNTMLSSEVA